MTLLGYPANHPPPSVPRGLAKMCHSGVGGSAHTILRKMGASADVAQGIFGYPYHACGLCPYHQTAGLRRIPSLRLPHRPEVGRSGCRPTDHGCLMLLPLLSFSKRCTCPIIAV